MVLLAVSANPYLQAVDRIVALPAEVGAARARLGLSLAQQARQIGISAWTLKTFTAGSKPSQSTVLACLRWMAKQ